MLSAKTLPLRPENTAYELLRRWPVSRATVYRAIKRGELAPPVRISKRRVAWPKPVVDQFLRAFVTAELGQVLSLSEGPRYHRAM
jgi:predicted DNA-binding transcriptional regulator AlpA